MLDTVRVGVPLTESQFKRVQDSAFASDRPQWAIFYPNSGELLFKRVVGLAGMDQSSFHREIRWDIPFQFVKDNTYLTVELSLPKLYYGHNIKLLYNFVDALNLLKSLLEKHFSLRGRAKLLPVYVWELWRIDCCYAWKCPSQQVAQQTLDALKHLHFPHKKPIIYPTSIVFAGTTYTVKFYLKLPEFKQHDLKALLRAKASLEWINHCEEIASGVLRVEATLRRKFLKRRGISTVADLLRPEIHYEFPLENLPEGYDFDAAFFAITSYYVDIIDDFDGCEGWDWSVIADDAPDGYEFNAPDGYEFIYRDREGEKHYRHNGRGFILRKTDQPTSILQFLLTKFLGKNPAMQHTDEVEVMLKAAFKPVKAARLMSMWLYVQRFGTQKAKEDFGHDSYYAARRDMKKAGVSLVEPPENVVRLDSSFIKRFRYEVPSEYAVNRVDDFRDGENVLNLPLVAATE